MKKIILSIVALALMIPFASKADDGKKLTWDGRTFHDAEADTYLCKTYREPWKLPQI